MKNKAIYALLACLLTATVSGCAANSPVDETSSRSSEEETSTATTRATETAPPETEKPKHLSANGIETKDDGNIHKEMTASQLAYLMGNGINLGNTMEAYGHKSQGVKADPSVYETLWGQPVTTQESISGMKAAGFDCIRIPVAWTNAMDFENGDYTIGEEYLNRVEEIINYAINEDMYVIINDHWDGGWWGMFGSASEETVQNAWVLYELMWKQICERYKEYGNHLIFESGNEELGARLNDTDYAPDSGTLDKDACYQVANAINQKFVDIVRSTGGNNANRFLLLAGYDTTIELTVDDRYKIPVDSVENKLMVSCHYYTPWNYCGDGSTVNQWGTSKEYESMYTSLTLLKKFTDAGIPVIIGEYGVLTDGTWEKNNTTDWMGALLDLCDAYGCVPVLWDCSTLYSRTEAKMKFEGTKSLFEKRSFAAQSAKMSEQQEKSAGLESFNKNYAAAPASFNPNAIATSDDKDKAVAWIMWNSGDYALSYSVGNVYSPDNLSAGVVPTDVLVTGEGTYVVSIDFTGAGNSKGTAFSAVGLFNGEDLFPGYTMEIIGFKINGEDYAFTGKPYTTSDDHHCTRVNLYNAWVTAVPADARRADGNTEGCAACVIPGEDLGNIEKVEVIFDYVSPENAEKYAADRESWSADVTPEIKS